MGIVIINRTDKGGRDRKPCNKNVNERIREFEKRDRTLRTTDPQKAFRAFHKTPTQDVCKAAEFLYEERRKGKIK